MKYLKTLFTKGDLIIYYYYILTTMVKCLFLDFNITKFYNSFFPFLYMLSKNFIFFLNLCFAFFGQISILHLVYGLISAN